MHAEAKTIGGILGGEKQFTIPVFQRSYSWDSQNWAILLADIQRIVLEGHHASTHFLGTIVCSVLQKAQDGCERLEVVDGQQRLITFNLLFAALRDLALDVEEENLGQFITQETLIREHARGYAQYRVVPRLRDRRDFFHLINKTTKGVAGPQGEAYLFFKQAFSDWLTHGVEDCDGEIQPISLHILIRSLYIKFNAALVRLEDENPFQVYQTLNNEGRPLTQSDLIRNHVFRNVAPEDQDAVDQTYWFPIESALQAPENPFPPFDLDRFFSYALSRHGDHVELNSVCSEFVRQYPEDELDPISCAQIFSQLAHWQSVIVGRTRHENPKIEAALAKIRFTGYETVSPLLILALERSDKGQDSIQDTCQLIDVTSSILVRRYFAGADSRSYYRWFRMAAGLLHLQGPKMAARQLVQRSTPDNLQFLKSVTNYHMNRNRSRAIRDFLLCIETHLRAESELIDASKCNLEHIRPKNDLYGAQSNSSKTEDNSRDDRWVYAIGNLTLIKKALNEEMANRPYNKKRETLKKSAFALNQYFERKNIKAWDDKAIEVRSQWIAQHALLIWPRFELHNL